MLILALICVNWGCKKAFTIKSNTGGIPNELSAEQTVIGLLKWEISEEATGKILATGDGPILLKDMLITERPSASGRIIDKRIKLTGEFDIGMAEFPTTNLAKKVGFGITAKRTDIQSFSWEWFTIGNSKRAVKLQESGELGIDLKSVNGAWEIARTEFITDVSLRIIRMGVDQPGSPPYWRVKIFKGSSLTWPSTVNGIMPKALESEAVRQLEVPALRDRVMDLAGALKDTESTDLRAKLTSLERDTTTQMVVFIIPSLKGEVLEKYSLRVANTWKLGRKDLNNGVLMLVAMQNRALRIEVGLGLETILTNEVCKKIIDNDIVPLFKNGEYYQVIDSGVSALTRLLESRKEP